MIWSPSLRLSSTLASSWPPRRRPRPGSSRRMRSAARAHDRRAGSAAPHRAARSGTAVRRIRPARGLPASGQAPARSAVRKTAQAGWKPELQQRPNLLALPLLRVLRHDRREPDRLTVDLGAIHREPNRRAAHVAANDLDVEPQRFLGGKRHQHVGSAADRAEPGRRGEPVDVGDRPGRMRDVDPQQIGLVVVVREAAEPGELQRIALDVRGAANAALRATLRSSSRARSRPAAPRCTDDWPPPGRPHPACFARRCADGLE